MGCWDSLVFGTAVYANKTLSNTVSFCCFFQSPSNSNLLFSAIDVAMCDVEHFRSGRSDSLLIFTCSLCYASNIIPDHHHLYYYFRKKNKNRTPIYSDCMCKYQFPAVCLKQRLSQITKILEAYVRLESCLLLRGSCLRYFCTFHKVWPTQTQISTRI